MDRPKHNQALGDGDEVCLCFHVPLGKVTRFIQREDPPVASLISECLGAGTGCGWCIPVLRKLHRQHAQGMPMEITVDPQAYASGRRVYQKTGERPQDHSSGQGSSQNPDA
jgi:bacterioferritin-associated ferredoxin